MYEPRVTETEIIADPRPDLNNSFQMTISYKIVGEERCPIVDTWWQTETGGIMISALPAITKLKPGSATLKLA